MNKFTSLTITLVIILLNPFLNVEASSFYTLTPNTAKNYYIDNRPFTVTFEKISLVNTVIAADSSLDKNVDYKITVTNEYNSLLFTDVIYKNDFTSIKKLANQYNDTIKITLEPLTDNGDYQFFVAFDKDPNKDSTIIYIGVSANINDFDFPDPQPCGPEGCMISPFSMNSFSATSSSSGENEVE